MKQRFLLSLLFVCSFVITTRAQISKGAIWLGGSIGYGSTKNKGATVTPEYKNTTLGISPAIGTVVKDNLVVGVKLTYAKNKAENYGSIIKSKSNTYGGGFFVRQYIPVITRLYIFGEAGAAYENNKATEERVDYNTAGTRVKTTTKGWSGSLNVTPGIAFAVTKKFQLETALNNLLGVMYSKSKTTADRNGYDNKSDLFSAGIFTDGKVQLNVGCRFLL